MLGALEEVPGQTAEIPCSAQSLRLEVEAEARQTKTERTGDQAVVLAEAPVHTREERHPRDRETTGAQTRALRLLSVPVPGAEAQEPSVAQSCLTVWQVPAGLVSLILSMGQPCFMPGAEEEEYTTAREPQRPGARVAVVPDARAWHVSLLLERQTRVAEEEEEVAPVLVRVAQVDPA